MQDINCVSLTVLALLFNPGMYECSKRNTTNKQNSSVFLCTLFMRQRVCEKFIFASIFQAVGGPFKKVYCSIFTTIPLQAQILGCFNKKDNNY